MRNTEEATKLRTEYSGDILTCAVIYFFLKKKKSCYTNNITFSAIITHKKITAIYIHVYIYVFWKTSTNACFSVLGPQFKCPNLSGLLKMHPFIINIFYVNIN